MPTDPYVPADPDARPRQQQNLPPGVALPPAPQWSADRPATSVPRSRGRALRQSRAQRRLRVHARGAGQGQAPARAARRRARRRPGRRRGRGQACRVVRARAGDARRRAGDRDPRLRRFGRRRVRRRARRRWCAKPATATSAGALVVDTVPEHLLRGHAAPSCGPASEEWRSDHGRRRSRARSR